MLESDNQKNISKPSIPSIPKIPVVPLLKTNINNPENTETKKFRLLNLIPLLNFSDNSVFAIKKDFDIDYKLVEDFFIIKNETKQIVKVKETKRETESPSVSSVLDKNKFTSIYISINKLVRAFNFELFLEKTDYLFFQSEDVEDEIINALLNEDYQRLLIQTFLTDSECNTVNNLNLTQTTSQTETWLLKIAKNKKIMSLIDSLYKLNQLINILRDESNNIKKYINCYEFIISDDAFRTLLNILMKINNFLKKSNGKKEDISFDIRSISNIITLKNNNKHFIDLLFSIYFHNSDINVNKNQLYAIKDVLESAQALISLSDHLKHEELLSSIKKTIEELNLNKSFLIQIKNKFSEISSSLHDILIEIQKEQSRRISFLDYLGFPKDQDKIELIHSIFSSCHSLLSKMPFKPVTPNIIKTNNQTVLSKKSIISANKENTMKASNLINKYKLN